MPVTCCVAPGSSWSSDCSLRRRPAPVPAMGHVQFRNAFHDGDVTKPARATHTGSPPGARPPLAPGQGRAARPCNNLARSVLGTGGPARGARAHLSGTRRRGCSEAPTPASARARDLQRPVMLCRVQRSPPGQRMRALAPRACAHARAAARAAYPAGHAAATGTKRTHEGAALRQARAAGLG